MEFIFAGIALFAFFYLQGEYDERERLRKARELEIARKIALHEANQNRD